MKNSTPISLFSFQDIITCLTGIMIVVVLVILLQLVESTVAMMARAEMQPEYEMLLKKEKELQEEKQRLLQASQQAGSPVNKYSELPMEELQKLLQEEKKYAVILAEQLKKFLERLQQQQSVTPGLQKQVDELRQKLEHLSADEHKIAELYAQLKAVQGKKVKILKDSVERKRKMLRFEFSGYDNKTPLLIGCYHWGFRCKVYPNGSVHTIGSPSKYTGQTSNLRALKSWLGKQNLTKCYPVFLFTKKSLTLFGDVQSVVHDIDQNLTVGNELILDSEEIF